MKICLCVGTRPNFIKAAPLIRAFKKYDIQHRLVYTGQHYDYNMAGIFFKELGIPKPAIDLAVIFENDSAIEQIAHIMQAFQSYCIGYQPDVIVVLGDVNSTLACALVASKLHIPIAHVEAGLRSFDRAMPEEINRMITDVVTDYFFVTEKSGFDNLKKEGKLENQIHFVGNVMVDNLLYQLKKLKILGSVGLEFQQLRKKFNQYAFLTLHRPSNVDNRKMLTAIVSILNKIAEESLPIIFPVHPRTAKRLKQFRLILSDKIYQMAPLGFQESLYFWKDAKFVITDSGGLQEETTALEIPCLTLRENTERPITISEGTNKLVGIGGREHEVKEILKGNGKKGKIPKLWDGKTAERIVKILKKEIKG